MNIFVKLSEYTNERFPPIWYFIITLLMFLSGILLSQITTANKIDFKAVITAIPALIVVYIFYFRLRIFDDIKDLDIDNKIHMERPIQRGLISLREIKKIAIAVIMIEILLHLFLGLKVFIMYLVPFLFSLLMLKEFFLRNYLRKDIFRYAVPHIVIMPLLGLYSYSIFPLQNNFQLFRWQLLSYVILCYMAGLIFEMTRKMNSINEERYNVPSFTKKFGHKGAWIIVSLLLLVSALSLISIAKILNHKVFPAITIMFIALIIGLIALFLPKYLIDIKAKISTLFGGISIIALFLTSILITILK